MFFSDNCLKLGEVAKKQRWLLVSFFIFGIVSVIVVAMRMYVDDQFSFYSLFKRVIGALFVRGTFYGNSALWFLLTLFIVKLLYFYIHTKVSDYFIVIVTFFILLLNFGLKQQNATINFMLSIPDYLYNSISGLMFYALGHVFKKNNTVQKYLFLHSVFMFY